MKLFPSAPNAETLALWAFVVVAAAARFVHLDADPKIEDWIGYVADEGRWVETARNLALFGDPGLYDLSRLHLALSPGFQAVNYAIFKLAGVSFWSARSWSAVAGAGILFVAFRLLRRHAAGLPLYLGLVVLAFEPLMLSMGRVALPEIPALLFTLLAFTAICPDRPPLFGAALGGLFMALAVAMKGTTLVLVPVFLLMIATGGVTGPARVRPLRSAAFLLGLLIPGLVGIALAFGAGVITQSSTSDTASALGRFFEFSGMYVLLHRFFEKSMFDVNMLLLGAWVGSWVLMFWKEYRGTTRGQVYLLSGVWAVGWLAIWMANAYLPERYTVQVIVPLTIHVVVGLGLWQIVGVPRVVTRIDEFRLRRGIALSLWLVLPTAVIVAASATTLAGIVGLPNDRFLYRIIAIVAVAAVLATLARTARAGESTVRCFLAYPVIAAVIGMVIDQVGAVVLSRDAADRTLPVVYCAMLGGLAWICMARVTTAGRILFRPSMKALACGVVLGVLVVRDWPVLFAPTHTIRDGSRTLARLFPDTAVLKSSGAGSMLLETRIRYRDQIAHNAVVDGILNFDHRVVPGPAFELVTTIRLAVHPGFYGGGRYRIENGAALLDVYRNSQSSHLSDASVSSKD